MEENLPEVHYRDEIVQRARIALGDLLVKWRLDHTLTRAEYLEMLVSEVKLTLEQAVQQER